MESHTTLLLTRNSLYKKGAGQHAHDHGSYHELHHSESNSLMDKIVEWPTEASVMKLAR